MGYALILAGLLLFADVDAHVREIAATDLPDFAPETFRAVRSRVREGMSAEESMRAERDLDDFETHARRMRKSIGKAHRLRNTALQHDFIRSADPVRFARAEREYQEARTLAENGQFEAARSAAARAGSEYGMLISDAQSRAKRQLRTALSQHQRSIRTDLAALGGDSNDAVEQIVQRQRSPALGFGINFDGRVIIEPGFPNPPGPNPAVGLGVTERGDRSIRLEWLDNSTDETGNRVVRTTDLSTWQTVAEVGTAPRFEMQAYTDTGLDLDRRYCYAIESRNALGARRSEMRCTYTRDGRDIGIWRLELRVKVADVSDAGTDETPRIIIGNDGQFIGVDTHLDYGRDDFERGSALSYDLNLGHIRQLSDLTDLLLTLPNGGSDMLLIEEVALLVNQHEVFTRRYGATSSSALKLTGLHSIQHAELRANPAWQAFVSDSQNPTFNVPPFVPGESGLQIRVPAEQLVSRMESIAGHTIHADSKLRAKLRWGKLHGAAVEISQAGPQALHVDLDMEGTVDIFPNPEVDIDFDLLIQKSCEDGKLVLDLTTANLTSDAGFPWWKDLLSLGVLPGVLAISEDSDTGSLSISQSIAVPLRGAADCQALDVFVQTDQLGPSLNICCITLFGGG